MTIDVPGVVVVDTRPAPGGGVILHLREVAGKSVMLDQSNVRTWADVESADEVNALGKPIRDGIESLELKPFDVRFVRLRFAAAAQ